MLVLNKQFPKIGDNIESFIEVFGQPAKESSDTLYLFDVEGIRPRLLCGTIDGQVINISWSLPYELNQVKEIALRFVPNDGILLKEGKFELKPLDNGDVPIKTDSYKVSVKDSDRFLDFGVGEDSTFILHLNAI